MKWFKHISDSLDDPFIYELMMKHGADGYLVFFGVLEIYSREFKPELEWKLDVTLSYLVAKLHKRQSKLVKDSLETIKNSGKWEINFNGERVCIFIPKFTELIDNWTIRKIFKQPVELRSNYVATTQPIQKKKKKKNKEEDKTLYSECVRLSESEHEKLINRFGINLTEKAITVLNNYIMSKGKDPYKSHYHTLIGWPMERAKENGNAKASVQRFGVRREPELSNEAERAIAEVKRLEREREAKTSPVDNS